MSVYSFDVAAVRKLLASDAALNDSDKAFTVPNGTYWNLGHAFVQLISDATVGNRQMRIEIQDGSGNVITDFPAGAVQAASLTRKYIFGPGLPNDAAFDANGVIHIPWPDGLVLPPTFSVRAYDSAAIAAATDDMTVRILGDEITIC